MKIELGDVGVFDNNPIYKPAECYAGRELDDLTLPYAPKIRTVNILKAYCDKLDASHRLCSHYRTTSLDSAIQNILWI